MKHLVYGAMMILALLPAHAQEKATAKANADKTEQGSRGGAVPTFATSDTPTATEILVGYAANVDRLLRGFADQMQVISQQAEAGDLSPLEALAMKLEVARAMIARLETISAVYDSVIFSTEGKPDASSGRDNSSDTLPPGMVLRTGRTVTAKELTQENAK